MIKDINIGDLLTFKASDEKYKALVCTSIYKDKSPQNFILAAIAFDNDYKPTIAEIIDSDFYGVGNTKNDYFKYTNKELRKMWSFHPEIKPCFLGSYRLTVLRKDFIKFHERFELIGNLNIIDNLDMNGNGGMNSSAMDVLDNLFINLDSILIEKRNQKRFKIKAILKA
jgi:hypothetical protein